MRNTRKSQCVGNFVGIECLNVVLFCDNTNGVGITKVVDAYHLPAITRHGPSVFITASYCLSFSPFNISSIITCPFFVKFHQSQCEGLTQALILS